MQKMITAGLRRAFAAVPFVLREIAIVGGIALVAYGAWLVYPPAGFITGGLLLLIGGILAAMATTDKAE